MLGLASKLPEFPVVMKMFGVGDILGPQLMAEIGDIRRFERKQSLIACAGVDAPPHQSGAFESKNRHISKRRSPRLRKTLFQVISTLLQHAPVDDPVFQFLITAEEAEALSGPVKIYAQKDLQTPAE